MTKREKIAIKLYQTFPECFFPKAFKDYCFSAAVHELATAKHELIRKRWEQSNLKSQLSKIKSKK